MATTDKIKREKFSFSDHDYLNSGANGTQDDEAELENFDAEGYGQQMLSHRRRIKRPEHFKIEHRSEKRKPTSGKKKVYSKKARSAETPLQFEVDYIFGKRADKAKKGKVEYRVFWKGYSLEDASWEPEDNLRFCADAVKQYERSQGLERPKVDKAAEKEHKPLGRSKSGLKGKKGRGSSVDAVVQAKLAKEEEGKKSSVSTTRARSISITKPIVKQISRSKEVRDVDQRTNGGGPSNFSSNETSPARSKSTSRMGRGRQPRGRRNNAIIVAAASTKMDEKSRHSSNVSTASNAGSTSSLSKLSAENIFKVRNVRESGIEGIGPVAEVILNDGTVKQATTKTLESVAPIPLIHCYERMLELRGEEDEEEG